MRITAGRGKASEHIHLVLGIGTTKVLFGGFLDTAFVILEQICKL